MKSKRFGFQSNLVKRFFDIFSGLNVEQHYTKSRKRLEVSAQWFERIIIRVSEKGLLIIGVFFNVVRRKVPKK